MIVFCVAGITESLGSSIQCLTTDCTTGGRSLAAIEASSSHCVQTGSGHLRHPIELTTGYKCCKGPGLVQMIAIKSKIKHVALYLAILFPRRKISSCAHLMLVTQSISRNKSDRLYFLAEFRSCLLRNSSRKHFKNLASDSSEP